MPVSDSAASSAVTALSQYVSEQTAAHSTPPTPPTPAPVPGQTLWPTIDVINASSLIKDSDVQNWIAAQQIQISRDFAPLWGTGANLNFLPGGASAKVLSGHWALVFMDVSDQQDALGYHDWTADGYPIGKVFVKSDLDNGSSWSVTASHETLEMLGDPEINLCAMGFDAQGNQVLYAYEACDAVEDDSLGYMINSVLLSNFVTPAWFNPLTSFGPFDFCKKLTSPFQILAGGYISVMNLNSSDGWTQIQAQTTHKNYTGYLSRAKAGSRRDRRKTHKQHWKRSRK